MLCVLFPFLINLFKNIMKKSKVTKQFKTDWLITLRKFVLGEIYLNTLKWRYHKVMIVMQIVMTNTYGNKITSNNAGTLSPVHLNHFIFEVSTSLYWTPHVFNLCFHVDAFIMQICWNFLLILLYDWFRHIIWFQGVLNALLT